jgi:hypothetical protein
MTFGVSAAGWAVIGAAVVGAGSAASSAHQQRKANDSANDRVREAAAEDKRLTAKAEADAALASGAQIADRKRRRAAAALGGGAFGLASTPAATSVSTNVGTVTALGGGG